MSRSRRRTPIVGMTTATSEKKFKQAEHQRERTQVRQTLHTFADDSAIQDGKAYGDPWKGDKDGRQYLRDVKKIAGRIASRAVPDDRKRPVRELHKLMGK